MHINGDIIVSGTNDYKLWDIGTLVDDYKTKTYHYFYNNTGDADWYEIIRVGPTGGWGARNVVFYVMGNGKLVFGMALFSYYNNQLIQARYITSHPGLTFNYKKNSDNTISIYCHILETFTSGNLRILSGSAVDYHDIICQKVDVPSGTSEFTSI